MTSKQHKQQDVAGAADTIAALAGWVDFVLSSRLGACPVCSDCGGPGCPRCSWTGEAEYMSVSAEPSPQPGHRHGP